MTKIANNWKLNQSTVNGITQIALLQGAEPSEIVERILSEWYKENQVLEDVSFQWFWETYKKSRGKDDCIRLWKNISRSEKNLIKKRLPDYVNNTEKQYRADPAKYLRRKMWNDEVIKVEKKEKDPFPTFFDKKLAAKLNPDQYQQYKIWLHQLGFKFGSGSGGSWVLPPKGERIWI